jgi:DnaJ like chaperone protein
MKDQFDKLRDWAEKIATNAPRWISRFHDRIEGNIAEEEHEKSEGFFQLTFALLAGMVRADGVIDPKEVAFVQHYIDSRFSFSEERRQVALKVFQEALESAVRPADYALGLKSLFPDSEVLLATVAQMMFDLAIVDGVISADEEIHLKEITEVFGFSSAEYSSMKSYALDNHFGSKEAGYYHLLGIKPGVGLDELAKGYRAQLWRFNPDNLKKQGLPQEFLLLAHRRIEQIEEAYAVLSLSFEVP